MDVSLEEPDKREVREWVAGVAVGRHTWVVLLDRRRGSTVELVVSLDDEAIVSERELRGVQTAITLAEYEECVRLVRADPRFQEALRRRGGAAFLKDNVWVTRHDRRERFPAGDYPNQHPGGAGLPQYQQADRPIVDEDIVLWYAFGMLDISRPEDWPVMPVERIGFTLKPVGFFDRNPSLDVPSPPGHATHGDPVGDPVGTASASGFLR